MDEDKLEKLRKETEVDNSKLEEMMSEEFTPKTQMEFIELLKQSRLFMPVTFSENMYESVENAEEGEVFMTNGPAGFDINYLKGHDGSRAVPLFTSNEKMEEGGLISSVVSIFMGDLAGMLKQTDRYSAVAINPFTEHDIVIPMEAFLSFFRQPTEEENAMAETLQQVLEMLKEHSVQLERGIALTYRSDEDLMLQNANDGVCIPNLPFPASTNPKYGEGMKYTNIILMDESKWILPGGTEGELDVIIAPGTEFELVEEPDEFTRIWKCGAQPFYDGLDGSD